MLIHLWWLYRTSDLLAIAVTSFLDATYKFKLVPKPMSLPEARWSTVLRQCATLSPEFFPDEWDLPYPLVIYIANPEQLSIDFPSTAGAHKMRGDVQVRTLTTVDGTYPTEKVPYMGCDAVSKYSTVERRN